MKQRLTAFLMAAVMLLTLCGCGFLGAREPEVITNAEERAGNTAQPDEPAAPEEKAAEEGTVIPEEEPVADLATGPAPEKPAGEETPDPVTDAAFSFSDVEGLEFRFSSGAGGWATWMKIWADGSFTGNFHDSDMGVTGEGYPNGTLYWSDFTGTFTRPERVNDYTWSMRIGEIHYAEELGKEEIKDGTLYVYTDAYGLTEAENILLYLPGAPLAELPEEFRSWIHYDDLSQTEETELPFYALNNEARQEGFSSYNVADSMRDYVASVEEQVSALEDTVYHDPNVNQADMNSAAQSRYELWDSALNTLWNQLTRTLDKETMRQLVAEEKKWINMKEQAMADAEAEGGGGSITATLVYGEGARLTRERVYELLELLINE